MFSRREADNLDHYLTASPPDDEDNGWCNNCGCVSGECDLPDEHAAEFFVTYAEHVQEEAEDMASEAWGER